MGHEKPSEVSPADVMKRVQNTGTVKTFAELYPRPQVGSLLRGDAPQHLQAIWDKAALQLPINSELSISSVLSQKSSKLVSV